MSVEKFKKGRLCERKKIKEADWTDMMMEMNTDVANSLFEDRYCEILDTVAPMSRVQICTHYNKWISMETKSEMKIRDILRDKARQTDSEADWSLFRQKRNLCTKLQKRDKANSLRDMFDRIETENESAGLHASTRELLGLKRSGPPRCFLQAGRAIREAAGTGGDSK